jgi:histidinol-phosphate aminotransferase
VFEALQTLDGDILRRYPNATADTFRQAAASVLGVPPDWIIVGNGSDDLLSLVVRACVEAGGSIAYPVPTYVLYRTLAEIHPAQSLEIPFPESFALPVTDLITAQAAVTFVAAPNSPSGSAIALTDLDTLAQHLRGLLVIDEAYVDFADGSALELVQRYANVIILRTLSKGYSLAGLRLGFGIAPPALLQGLRKVQNSYTVDAIACRLGAAAILDQDYQNQTVAKVIAERRRLSAQLEALGFRVWPSATNFVMVQPPTPQTPQNPAGLTAEALMLELKVQGIYIRHFQTMGLADKLRITIGAPTENNQLWQQMQALLLG